MSHPNDESPEGPAERARDAERRRADEVQILLSEIVSELRKVGESLKLMSVYLDRVRRTLPRTPPPTTTH